MLGERLKKLRKQHSLSQKELSKKLEISRGAYAHYEVNKRQPDYETLKKIANYFNVSLDFLIRGNEFTNSSDEMYNKFLDPKTQIFFKNLQDAPEDKIEELILFWDFIQERDKNK
ncbi:helix-turn-helix transcriptional regulator [Oceanobacillus sp. FSL W8-0428]|uniref:helix-turn-helix domain-containing protein n=1 Tax=Oceanobacillus sp. FSL W8-0428 TaxID=2921715 RepID=UPI0030FB0F1D